MGRILAIDYGIKRTGLAVTDQFQMIATPLETIESAHVLSYLKGYFEKETVDQAIIGMPKRLNNTDSEMAPAVRKFIELFQKKFPHLPIQTVDERFSSSIAKRAMVEGGMKKKNRQVKGNVDTISATIILQSYLQLKG